MRDVNVNMGRPVKTFSVTSRIIDSKTGKPIENIDYRLDTFSDGKRTGGVPAKGRSNSLGEVTIDNIPPGEYSIRVPALRNESSKDEVPAAPNIFGASPHFTVVDKNVDGIEIRVDKAITVSGFVVIDGPAGIDILNRVSQMHVVAMVLPKPGGANPIMRANIKPDGSFIFTGLNPGQLRFSFDAPSTGDRLPLRLVRVERNGIKMDHDPEIESGDQISGLHLVLAYAKSSIEGVVKFTGGVLPAGEKLIARAFLNQDGLGFAPVDDHGRFVMQDLPAGEYRLVIGILNSAPNLAEQKVIVSDNAVTTTVVTLDLSARATPR